jgi:hypothetical protein
MKQGIRCAALAAITVATLSLPLVSMAQAQTSPPASGTMNNTTGGATGSDTHKPANGEHGNNGSNGG